MAQFLEGVRNTTAIAWLDTNEGEDELAQTMRRRNNRSVTDRVINALEENKYSFIVAFLSLRYLATTDSALRRWLGAGGVSLMSHASKLDLSRVTTFLHTVVSTATSFVYTAVVNIYT